MGGLRALGMTAVAAVVVLTGCEPEQAAPRAGSAVSSPAPAPAHPAPRGPAVISSAPIPPAVVPATIRPSAAASARPPALLRAARGGDGDSWKDTHGREYRLGLVNTPEYDECYGAQATAKRKSLVAAGFTARVYQTDAYGRAVAVVTSAAGLNVNVYLARHGYADDRYLARYRHENPGLAAQLDAAFAAAKRERVGLWGSCGARGAASSTTAGSGEAAPQPVKASRCHSAYSPCIPVKGDGSGRGSANDLDCGDIRQQVTVREPGVDPYRLDADRDGYGCESYG